MKRLLLLAAIVANGALYAQIDTTLVRQDIEVLASEEFGGRAPATKGDTLSRNYIAQRFSSVPSVKLLGDNGLQKGYTMSHEIGKGFDRSKRDSYKNNKVEIKSLSNIPSDLEGKSVEIDSMLVHTEGFEAVRAAVEELKENGAAIIRYPLPIHNVVAKISAPKENNKNGESIIIGAHYDHLGYKMYKGEMAYHVGADDNASGVAVVLDLARAIGQRQEELTRDVIFITFGGEEIGLCGSEIYARNPLEPMTNTELMINFDMLGRMTNKGITVRGLGTSPEAVSVMNSLDNKEKLDIIWEFRGNGPTDYASFYMFGKVPALSFSTRIHKDYHLPLDTPDKINYEGLKMATNYIWQLVEKAAFQNEQFTYVDMY